MSTRESTMQTTYLDFSSLYSLSVVWTRRIVSMEALKSIEVELLTTSDSSLLANSENN